MHYSDQQQPANSSNTHSYRFKNVNSKQPQWTMNSTNNSNHIPYPTTAPTTAHVYYNNDNPLQEPVAFEDFQFSLGLDPEFAMPIPLDIPPPPAPAASSINFTDIYRPQYQQNSSVPAPSQHIFLSANNAAEQIPHSFPNSNTNNVILDEEEQKAFSQWLDQFFVDPNLQTAITSSEPSPQQPKDLVMTEPGDIGADSPSSASENTTIRKSNAANAPLAQHQRTESCECNDSRATSSSAGNSSQTKSSSNSKGTAGGALRRTHHKELLTEQEKRNNHIASEQKRRSMIRSGFKSLTDIVPTLSKGANNSKSTILFKSVDYIKYLESKNDQLREKLKQLQFRAQVESKIKAEQSTAATSSATATTSTPHDDCESLKADAPETPTTATSLVANSTDSALRLHKYQQRQLRELQEKLHLHQQLLLQRNSKNSNSESSSSNDNVVTA